MKAGNRDGGWSPYIAGALVGVLAVVSVYATTSVLGKSSYLGASTTFVRAAGYIVQALLPDSGSAKEYFSMTRITVDWQFMLVIGICIGAFISSLTDRSFKLESVPPVWSRRFGKSISVRAIGAFLGGVLAMFGARLADGCPSGHGLSGIMQLSVSGFAALCLFFAAGCIVAHSIYKGR
jgi:uncharacterized membrane protein YedE/YeeE